MVDLFYFWVPYLINETCKLDPQTNTACSIAQGIDVGEPIVRTAKTEPGGPYGTSLTSMFTEFLGKGCSAEFNQDYPRKWGIQETKLGFHHLHGDRIHHLTCPDDRRKRIGRWCRSLVNRTMILEKCFMFHPIWGFPKSWGYPLSSSISRWDFP